jgi:hypothetical protein
MSLIDKIRKAREIGGIEADGHTFTIRRPTDEEATRWRTQKVDMFAVVKTFVIGWDLTELDLIPGGSPVAVPFDAELFAEWVADQPSVWEPLGQAVLEAYKAHTDKRTDAAKN